MRKESRGEVHDECVLGAAAHRRGCPGVDRVALKDVRDYYLRSRMIMVCVLLPFFLFSFCILGPVSPRGGAPERDRVAEPSAGR